MEKIMRIEMANMRVIEIMHLYEKRKKLRKELNKVQERLRKLRNKKLQPWVLKNYLRVYKKFGFKWVKYQKMAKVFTSDPRKASVYFQYLRKAGLVKRKLDEEDKRKSIYSLKNKIEY